MRVFNRQIWLLILPLTLILNSGFGQSNSNPFELTPRIEKAEQNETDNEVNTELTNPFDIRVKKAKTKAEALENIQSDTSKNSFSVFDKRINESDSEEAPATEAPKRRTAFTFWIILTLLLYLSLLITLMRPLFAYIFRSFVNDNVLGQLYREQSKGPSIPFSLLYLLFFISTGIFIFLGLQHYGIRIDTNNFKSLLIIIGSFAGIVAFKHILITFTGWLLPKSKEILTYNFTVVVFNIVIGIALIPLSIMLAYGPGSLTTLIIWLGLLVFAIIYLFRFLRGLFISSSLLVFYKFHFLLYLCTVEIAPALVLIKILMINSHA